MHAPFFSLEFLCISLWLLGRASCVVILLKWCKNIHPSYLHMWDPAIGFFCTFTVNCNCGGSMPRRWNFDHCSFANPPELSWWDSPSFPGERCPPGGEHNEPHAPPTPRVHLLLLRLQPASQRPAENAGCLHRLKTYVLKHYWKVCEEWFFFFFFRTHNYCVLFIGLPSCTGLHVIFFSSHSISIPFSVRVGLGTELLFCEIDIWVQTRGLDIR